MKAPKRFDSHGAFILYLLASCSVKKDLSFMGAGENPRNVSITYNCLLATKLESSNLVNINFNCSVVQQFQNLRHLTRAGGEAVS